MGKVIGLYLFAYFLVLGPQFFLNYSLFSYNPFNYLSILLSIYLSSIHLGLPVMYQQGLARQARQAQDGFEPNQQYLEDQEQAAR